MKHVTITIYFDERDRLCIDVNNTPADDELYDRLYERLTRYDENDSSLLDVIKSIAKP